MIGALLSMLPWAKNASDKADSYLNATISSRAAQTTADTINGKLDVTLSTRASQSDLNTVKTNTDVKTSTRASSSDMSTLLGRVPSDNTTKMARLDMNISAISPIRSIQFIVVSSRAPTGGSGVDAKYYDETISTAVNTTKTVVYLQGYCVDNGTGEIYPILQARMNGGSTVRVHCALSKNVYFVYSFYVIEYW